MHSTSVASVASVPSNATRATGRETTVASRWAGVVHVFGTLVAVMHMHVDWETVVKVNGPTRHCCGLRHDADGCFEFSLSEPRRHHARAGKRAALVRSSRCLGA